MYWTLDYSVDCSPTIIVLSYTKDFVPSIPSIQLFYYIKGLPLLVLSKR